MSEVNLSLRFRKQSEIENSLKILFPRHKFCSKKMTEEYLIFLPYSKLQKMNHFSEQFHNIKYL